MALVKADDQKYMSSWSKRDKKAVRHKLPDDIEKPVIDYEKLKQLSMIDGLKDRKNDESTADAHEEFMATYKSIFVRPEPKKGFPIHSLHRSHNKGSTTTLHSRLPGGKTLTEARPVEGAVPTPADTLTHDIRDYLPLLHKGHRSHKMEVVRGEQLKLARKVIRKLPFERSAAENDQLYSVLRTVPDLAAQVSPDVLKELCVVATLDEWKDQDITVFGNTGWHLVLRGSVKAQTTPHQLVLGDDTPVPCPTPPPPAEDIIVSAGECFGTLEKVEGRETNSKILTVLTNDTNCEFLKISCKNYVRVIEKMKERDRTEKVNLLQACKTFNGWSGQPLISVADIIEWTKFPANTVLVSEGYKAPFIGFIKSGTCHVLRQVEVKGTLPNGAEEKKTKQVVMGKLGATDSFGEISVITKDPITCSIITADSVELASIDPARIEDLDDTTKQLLLHSSEPTYGTLTQTDIHEEYVQQELKREWNEFKHNVVVDVINSRGIRPGYGKWSK